MKKIKSNKLIMPGTITALFFIILGGILFILQYGNNQISDYKNFYSEPINLRFIPDMLANAMKLDAKSMIQFGLYILILLQLLRVALAGCLFIRLRDKYFITMSTFIICIMLVALSSNF